MVFETHSARRRAAGFILLAASVAMVTSGCKDKSTEPPRSAATQPAKVTASRPAAKGLEADVMRASFLKQHKLEGSVVLIEFGTVGCKVSEQGLEEMAFLHGMKGIPGLAFARVELSEDASAVERYYGAKAIEFPVHRDPQRKLAEAFDAMNVPTFVLVGKFGRVRYRGSWPEANLAEWAEALIGEKADPGPDVALLGTVQLDGTKLLAATKLPDLTGRQIALEEVWGGRGLLVLFVDATCPYAKRAMGDMPTVARTLALQSVRSIAINIDGTEQAVKNRFGADRLVVPLLYDATAGTKDAWNIQSVPTVAYIDPDKKVAYYGRAVWADVAPAIESAAGLKPGSIRFTAKGTKYG